jgi:imidazoleglycerol phosphate dehydratase HisB
METINPPSLFAYFLTLPTWAKSHPIIRDVVMAFEYHQPDVDIRQKELALNFAVSMIRPIDETLENVIIDIAASNKIRLNAQLGKEAINSLKFYEIDPELLGTTSESEELP